MKKSCATFISLSHFATVAIDNANPGCPWGQNWPRPRGHKFETYEQRRKTLKFFFSETRKCKALIFGMKHLLVDLYQDCSYDAPGIKTGPAQGVTSSKHRNKQGKLQNSSSLKLESADL